MTKRGKLADKERPQKFDRMRIGEIEDTTVQLKLVGHWSNGVYFFPEEEGSGLFQLLFM